MRTIRKRSQEGALKPRRIIQTQVRTQLMLMKADNFSKYEIVMTNSRCSGIMMPMLCHLPPCAIASIHALYSSDQMQPLPAAAHAEASNSKRFLSLSPPGGGILWQKVLKSPARRQNVITRHALDQQLCSTTTAETWLVNATLRSQDAVSGGASWT